MSYPVNIPGEVVFYVDNPLVKIQPAIINPWHLALILEQGIVAVDAQ
jgi:hypothetical protein